MIRFGQRCKSTEHFQSLTRKQQEHIWVWFWASVAQAESSCRPSAQVNGIWNSRFGRYNTADGLFQSGGKLFDRSAQADEKSQSVAKLIYRLTEHYQTNPSAIALAWLLRHPANIQPIVGTLDPARLAESCQADHIEITRKDWYQLFAAANGTVVP
jgi:aryl-alcohol dehydrogenase-like predicted oxidoreductase